MTKSEASRRNGAQSKGPITPEGKTRSAQNATKHGLDSKVVVLANESQEEYDDLLWDYVRHYQPIGAIELDLVHEIAANRWRMRRCLRLESAALDAAFEQNPDAVLDGAFGPNGAIRTLSRYEGRLRRAYERATAELRRIQSERIAEAEAKRANTPEERNEPKSYLDIYRQAVQMTPNLPSSAPKGPNGHDPEANGNTPN